MLPVPRLSRSLVALGACLAAALTAALPAAATASPDSAPTTPSGKHTRETPPGQLLIADANLLEAFNAADVADETDMATFARRLLAQTPYVPDVVPLQEVIGPSAATVARELTALSGYPFEVAVAPGATAFVGQGRKRETAVVVNTGTMRPAAEGGFVATGTWDPARGEEAKEQAHTLVEERHGGLRVAIASVHLDPADRDKGRSAAAIDDALTQTYDSPSARQVEVIGGDLNRRRCESADTDAPDCAPSPHWQVLVGRRGYLDALHSTGWYERMIDYVFARAAVPAAGHDESRKVDVEADGSDFAACKQLFTQGRGEEATGSCREHFYADHSFVWALVAMPLGR